MNPRRTKAGHVAWLLALAILTIAPPRAWGEEVRIGVTAAALNQLVFIADERGYFKHEGISVTVTDFASGAQMVPSIAAGHIDVGGGIVSAGIFNAVERDIGLKLVCDAVRVGPGSHYEGLLVRKALIDSGKFKSFHDLKGLTAAIPAKANGNESILRRALAKGGLTLNDVTLKILPFPQQPAAFANGAIDTSVAIEPVITNLKRAGTAVLFAPDPEFSNNPARVTEDSLLVYGDAFIKNGGEAPQKFMRAIIRASRFYNDALDGDHLRGPKGEEVIAILVKRSKFKDAALFREMSMSGADPDGMIYLPVLRDDWNFFKELGAIDGKVSVDDVVDLSFAKKASKSLGLYHRGKAE